MRLLILRHDLPCLGVSGSVYPFDGERRSWVISGSLPFFAAIWDSRGVGLGPRGLVYSSLWGQGRALVFVILFIHFELSSLGVGGQSIGGIRKTAHAAWPFGSGTIIEHLACCSGSTV